MAEFFSQLIGGLISFEFYYPLFMAYLWMIGAIYYLGHWEYGSGLRVNSPPKLGEYPGVSILVPCFNEGENVEETIEYLANQQYPEFEIIAINDGSKDNTGEILDRLAERYQKLRVIHLTSNQGKAMALRMGAMASNHEFLICVDGDALLDQHATTWIMQHFIRGPRVGAVTGNPRVRTRSTLLGKIQVGEFSAIVGMIKRAQRIYGRVFTISGVVAGFRKSAIHSIGYWHMNTVTEDIDISWNLQLNRWDIRFEPNALCWILMPETLRGMWRQRLRWAQGGMETFMRHLPDIIHWNKRRMWMVYLEYITSVAWAYLMVGVILLWLIGLIMPLPAAMRVPTVLPTWSGVLLGITCMLQFAVALLIDSRFERGIGKIYYWMIWYPVVYWQLNVLTAVVAAPKAMLKRRGTRATWVSPDRGLRP